MESNSRTTSQEIIETLEKIVILLNKSDCPLSHAYFDFFKRILGTLNGPHEVHKAAEEILATYGGMGSFNDVVLVKNREVLLKEQSEFSALKTKLYLICQETIVEYRGGYIVEHPQGDFFLSLEMVEKMRNGEEVPEEILKKINGELI